MTPPIDRDIAAITRIKKKFVAWAGEHAALDDPLIVAMALFDLSLKILIGALGDQNAAYSVLRRALEYDADPTRRSPSTERE